MKIYQRGTGKPPMKKRISNTGGGFQRRLKDACEKLTQKQRWVAVWVLLALFAVSAAASVADIFRDGIKLPEPGHISRVKISGDNPKDTVSLKITNNEKE